MVFVSQCSKQCTDLCIRETLQSLHKGMAQYKRVNNKEDRGFEKSRSHLSSNSVGQKVLDWDTVYLQLTPAATVLHHRTLQQANNLLEWSQRALKVGHQNQKISKLDKIKQIWSEILNHRKSWIRSVWIKYQEGISIFCVVYNSVKLNGLSTVWIYCLKI